MQLLVHRLFRYLFELYEFYIPLRISLEEWSSIY